VPFSSVIMGARIRHPIYFQAHPANNFNRNNGSKLRVGEVVIVIVVNTISESHKLKKNAFTLFL